MKTIGLIGGMSWESTVLYYQSLNRIVRRELGGHHSAKIILYSVDFAEIEACMRDVNWQPIADAMIDAGQRLENAGAEVILICTNTVHQVAPDVEDALSIPLLHIADAAAEQIVESGLKRVALLGTAFTMELPFYRDRLADLFKLQVIVPEQEDRAFLNSAIFNELVHGVVKEESRARMKSIIASLVDQGAEGVILGCTELPMIIHPEDSPVPLFDTTQIHAEAAADFALKGHLR